MEQVYSKTVFYFVTYSKYDCGRRAAYKYIYQYRLFRESINHNAPRFCPVLCVDTISSTVIVICSLLLSLLLCLGPEGRNRTPRLMPMLEYRSNQCSQPSSSSILSPDEDGRLFAVPCRPPPKLPDDSE